MYHQCYWQNVYDLSLYNSNDISSHKFVNAIRNLICLDDKFTDPYKYKQLEQTTSCWLMPANAYWGWCGWSSCSAGFAYNFKHYSNRYSLFTGATSSQLKYPLLFCDVNMDFNPSFFKANYYYQKIWVS